MKKILGILCLCMCVLLGNAMLVDLPDAEAASRIVITQVSPAYDDGNWVSISGGRTSRNLKGDILRVVVQYTGAPSSPKFEIGGGQVSATEIGSRTIGSVIEKTYQITGMIQRAGLSAVPGTDMTIGLDVWNWNGASKVTGTAALTYQAYVDWR